MAHAAKIREMFVFSFKCFIDIIKISSRKAHIHKHIHKHYKSRHRVTFCHFDFVSAWFIQSCKWNHIYASENLHRNCQHSQQSPVYICTNNRHPYIAYSHNVSSICVTSANSYLTYQIKSAPTKGQILEHLPKLFFRWILYFVSGHENNICQQAYVVARNLFTLRNSGLRIEKVINWRALRRLCDTWHTCPRLSFDSDEHCGIELNWTAENKERTSRFNEILNYQAIQNYVKVRLDFMYLCNLCLWIGKFRLYKAVQIIVNLVFVNLIWISTRKWITIHF